LGLVLVLRLMITAVGNGKEHDKKEVDTGKKVGKVK
jgi:hypothetical protein